MTVKVKVSANYDRWIAGFRNLDREMATTGRRAWEAATDVMFDRSQSYAHVLTGENKASGHAEVLVEAGEFIGRIEYDSDHAIYENARGGEHAFIDRAWEATEAQFRDAIPEAWAEVVTSWR